MHDSGKSRGRGQSEKGNRSKGGTWAKTGRPWRGGEKTWNSSEWTQEADSWKERDVRKGWDSNWRQQETWDSWSGKHEEQWSADARGSEGWKDQSAEGSGKGWRPDQSNSKFLPLPNYVLSQEGEHLEAFMDKVKHAVGGRRLPLEKSEPHGSFHHYTGSQILEHMRKYAEGIPKGSGTPGRFHIAEPFTGKAGMSSRICEYASSFWGVESDTSRCHAAVANLREGCALCNNNLTDEDIVVINSNFPMQIPYRTEVLLINPPFGHGEKSIIQSMAFCPGISILVVICPRSVPAGRVGALNMHRASDPNSYEILLTLANCMFASEIEVHEVHQTDFEPTTTSGLMIACLNFMGAVSGKAKLTAYTFPVYVSAIASWCSRIPTCPTKTEGSVLCFIHCCRYFPKKDDTLMFPQIDSPLSEWATAMAQIVLVIRQESSKCIDALNHSNAWDCMSPKSQVAFVILATLSLLNDVSALQLDGWSSGGRTSGFYSCFSGFFRASIDAIKARRSILEPRIKYVHYARKDADRKSVV